MSIFLGPSMRAASGYVDGIEYAVATGHPTGRKLYAVLSWHRTHAEAKAEAARLRASL